MSVCEKDAKYLDETGIQISVTRNIKTGKDYGMKTTIDIPDRIMEEAASYANVKTKREVILAALEEYNHKHRVAEIMKMFGTFTSMPTNDEIEALEEGEILY